MPGPRDPIRAEEVAAVHARLRALRLPARAAPVTVEDTEQPASGGWVPDTTPVDLAGSTDQAGPTHAMPEIVRGLLDRVALRPAAAAGLVLVSLLALAGAGVMAWQARARPVTAVAPPVTVASAGTAATATPGVVVVDVAGSVRRPGLVTLPAGSRVADALRAAGGPRPGTDLTSINLARRLVDGEQIVVGGRSAGAAANSGPAPGGAAAGGLVNLNTATVSDFDALPGIGPVLAQRIIDWRSAHGGFTAVAQLRQVSGIGDSKYAQIKEHVVV